MKKRKPTPLKEPVHKQITPVLIRRDTTEIIPVVSQNDKFPEVLLFTSGNSFDKFYIWLFNFSTTF